MAKVNIINLLSMIGDLNDKGENNSSRSRFISNYLYKLVNIEEISNDIKELVKFVYNTNTKEILYLRAYTDLINRFAQIVGFSVEYCEYQNSSGLSGIWKAGNKFINVIGMIPGISNKIDKKSDNLLYIFNESYNIGVQFITIEKLTELFSLAISVNLPASVLWGILSPDFEIDKRIDPLMELILLGFKKKIAKHTDFQSVRKDWTEEELNDFLFNKIKEPTYYFLMSLIDNKLPSKDLVVKINNELSKRNIELLKSPMALGALMGTMTKHYSGIKEPLVIREGKYYKLENKYNDVIKKLCSP